MSKNDNENNVEEATGEDFPEEDSGELNHKAKKRQPKTNGPTPEQDIEKLFEVLEEQSDRLERFIEWTQDRLDTKKRVEEETLPRCAIFVDSANIELALDRSKRRLDWGKVLQRLTKGRRLVRAIAYSPVHEDVNVSMESQRFVEPFLGNGYKVITKPLKRFSDGTVKANVDIELAIDLLTMSDRLDIACIVSGDGDFQPLVEAVQSRGVRVEVACVGNAIAGHLRKAADEYINLEQLIR